MKKNPYLYGSSRWEKFEERSLRGRIAYVKRTKTRAKKYGSPNNPYRVGTSKWAEFEVRSLRSRVSYAKRNPKRGVEPIPDRIIAEEIGPSPENELVLWDVKSDTNKKLRPTEDAFGVLAVLTDEEPWKTNNSRALKRFLPGEFDLTAVGSTFNGDSTEEFPWTLHRRIVGIQSYVDVVYALGALIRERTHEFSEDSKGEENPSPWVHLLYRVTVVPVA